MAPAPSSSKIKVGDASGTDDPMAMPIGTFNPEIKAALTIAPEVVYSPTVPLPDVAPFTFVTNRFPPDTAIPSGPVSPETSAGFTVAPEVVYSPIVPWVTVVTNRSPPDTVMRRRPPLNPEIKAALKMKNRFTRAT
jgi:hypothetical protein